MTLEISKFGQDFNCVRRHEFSRREKELPLNCAFSCIRNRAKESSEKEQWNSQRSLGDHLVCDHHHKNEKQKSKKFIAETRNTLSSAEVFSKLSLERSR